MPAENPILVALDVPTPTQAIDLARQVAPYVGGFKVGLELFTSGGSEVVAAIRELGSEVFLDLKFHDIPNTCLLYTSPSPRDRQKSRMPSSA